MAQQAVRPARRSAGADQPSASTSRVTTLHMASEKLDSPVAGFTRSPKAGGKAERTPGGMHGIRELLRRLADRPGLPADLAALINVCRGNGFRVHRDEAMIRRRGWRTAAYNQSGQGAGGALVEQAPSMARYARMDWMNSP